MKKILTATFLLLATASLVAQEPAKPTVEQLFSVQTVKVKKSTVAHTKKNYGYVKADDARIYDVAPRFGGFVEKLYVDKIYTYVKKGQPLAVVYSPEVFKAKEDYINSYRYSKIKNNKGMLRSAKLKLELLGVSQQEINEVIKNKKASKNTTIYAPISGYIFAKNITHGSAFNAKNKLFEIVNIDEVWVEAKIFEDDIAWMKNANKFTVSFKTTPKIFTTSNKLLYPNLDPKEATLTMRLRLKNSGNTLFPGMYANIISQSSAKEMLTLPQTAVILKDGKYYAFVVGEYEGEYEPVEIGAKPLDAHTYIITDGLNEGDEVVNNALFMMDSDAQINGLY